MKKNIKVNAPIVAETPVAVAEPKSEETPQVVEAKAELVVLSKDEKEAADLLKDDKLTVDDGFNALWLTALTLAKTAGNKYCEAVVYITDHFHPEATPNTEHWAERKLGQKRVLKTLLLSGMSVGSSKSTVSRLFQFAHPDNAEVLGMYGRGEITQDELRQLTSSGKAELVATFNKGEMTQDELLRKAFTRQPQLPSGESNGNGGTTKQSPEEKAYDAIREACGIVLRLETPWTVEQFVEAAQKTFNNKKELIETQKLEAAKKAQEEKEKAEKAS